MTTLLIRTDPTGPAALVDPVQPGARIFPGLERLQALVEGDRPYALTTEIQADGSRILSGGHDRLEPLGRISAAECARFVGMGQPVLQVHPLRDEPL